MIINAQNLQQAKNLIKKSKEKPIIVQAQDYEFNRKILEYGKFDILLSIESAGEKKDKLKYIDSGLNEVLGKIAAKNHVTIGIDLEKIKTLQKKEKAVILARIIQNIKICRKKNCKLSILNYKDKKNAAAFLISLGASTKQTAEACKQ